MTRAPLIGLTGRRKLASDIAGFPANIGDLAGDWYFADYARGIIQAGGLPVNLPQDADPTLYLDRLDGILLSGGADIDPSRYGRPSETDLYPPEPARDEFEFTLLDGAVERALPVLGICRGLQLVNVQAGGTLHQHVPDEARYDAAPHSEVQTVDIVEGSQVHAMYGSSHGVNSLHHQTVDDVGDGLIVTATSGDTVEALEHAELPILAVQWHPEMMATPDTDPVFRWIVEAAAARIS